MILEVKVIESRKPDLDPLPWHKFEAHQKGWLLTAVTRNALSLVALYSKGDGEMWIYHVQGVDIPAHHLFSVQLELGHLSDDTAYWGNRAQWDRLLAGDRT